MDKKQQPKIIRFLESLGLEDVTRFGMDFEFVASDSRNKSLVHMTIRKETPWDYALMTEFMDALQNATFLMDIRFVYADEPGEEDVSELFSNFCFDKYRLMSDISVKYQDGHYVTKKEEGIEAAVQDFNELLAFLSYGLKIEVVDELKEEKPEPKKEEAKAEPQPVEETPEEEDSEEPEEENEEGFAEENENAPEEYDAIAEDMAQHDEELKEAYVHFKENERIQEQLSHNIHSKGNYYRLDSIKELYDNYGGNFEITGYVFGYELRTTRRGQAMATFGLGDDTSAINVRGVEDKEVLSPAVLGSISNGAHLRVRGAIEIEKRPGPNEGLYQFYLHSFDVLPPKPLRDDPCEEKRVELHAHTKMSAMDGLADASDYVKLAHHMGMKAVAITDHGVIQSFPEAEGACLKINEKITDAEDKFKVLYGVELYAFRNPRYGWNYVDTPLSKGKYCVFDFETTGLSSKYDRITEFGAVLVVDGMVRDRKDFFVNAGMHIPEIIQKKTHITDEMIKDGLTEKEAALEIEKFTEGCILVSHNASFDVGFLNAMRLRVGLPKDTHPVIDTLALSHYLFPAAARHNLGSLSRNLKLDVYDEDKAHRADFDAEALNSVWQAIIPILEKNGCNTHKDLKDLVCTDKKMYKHIKAEHVIAIAKNQEGIKALYRLVSHSETKYMTLNSVPKITYDEIEKERENLLLGSACFNGHVFQNAMLKSDEELEEAMEFFDYIEVQPRENYSWLINDRQLDNDRLMDILHNIVNTADKIGKPVCATGDCHYLNPEDKVSRDVFICAKAIGGVNHPLWTRPRENGTVQYENPDQHFRTTKEMLDEFTEWLGEEKAKEIVITNTNKIADQVEPVEILKTRLYTPDANLPGSKEKLEEICWTNLKNRYGIDRETEYPEGSPQAIIKDRLAQELNGIIGNGYAVTYYIAHLLVKKAADDGFFVGSRGSVGSSFAATMADITEVNPLAPHYVCPHCKHIEWAEDKLLKSAYDLPAKKCPECGKPMITAGQSIPFQVFLGFHAEKVPDIDLNFDADYQSRAHAYTRELLSTPEENKLYKAGETVDSPHVIRAGTISCSEEKNAIGYVKGYYERVLRKPVALNDNAYVKYIASKCTGVKKTTGQHPGGIVVIPADMEIFDFSPYQYPADDESVGWLTTHYEFASMHDSCLKLDELGHVDPLALRKMKDMTGIDFKTIPMNDKKVLSLFTTNKALGIMLSGNSDTQKFIADTYKTGSIALPEFGTTFVQGLIKQAKPHTFNDLLIISGLSHGTDVWNNNAQDLIMKNNLELNDVIGCRDDIMNYLIDMGVDHGLAFKIMEYVRKNKNGKPLKDEFIAAMKEHNVPDWYIESCKKIRYLFPRAHATAYVMSAVRVAWYKVYKPAAFYAVYFSTRCDSFDIKAMTSPIDKMVATIKEYQARRDKKQTNATDEEKLKALLAACEATARGFKVGKVDLMKSHSSEWTIGEDGKTIVPPFTVIPNFGSKAAEAIEEARKEGEFLSIEDLKDRANLGSSTIDALREYGSLEGMNESNQLSLFDFSF